MGQLSPLPLLAVAEVCTSSGLDAKQEEQKAIIGLTATDGFDVTTAIKRLHALAKGSSRKQGRIAELAVGAMGLLGLGLPVDELKLRQSLAKCLLALSRTCAK